MPLRLPRPLEFKPDQLFRVPTRDGSAITLGRYLPRGDDRFIEPVILAHSLATNRFNLDFNERYSVAQALARRGFEAWVVELRGHGLAGSAQGSSFDVEAIHDVQAALSAVTSTGAPRVMWVGHSRGGLLGYAHLARFPNAPIAALATLASPVSFSASPGLARFVTAVSPVLKLDVIPLKLASMVAVPVGIPPDPIGKYLVRKENMEREVIRQALSYAAADLPGGVARAFVRWIQRGVFDGDDGFDYRKHLLDVRAPIFAISGAADHLATTAGVCAISGMTSGPVELFVAGRAAGLRDDYGHGDLVLGRNAPEEVIAPLIAFLVRHATPHRGATS